MKQITIEECASKAGDNLAEVLGWDWTEQKLRVRWEVGSEECTLDQTAEEFYRDCGGDPADAVAFCEGAGYYPDIAVFESVAERDAWMNQK